ncbi:MAG: VTT domain-containing protein [Gemmatimonadetes bacterium]|nr:VTT domain-containing protein [Gemmatimonadota bacterium]
MSRLRAALVRRRGTPQWDAVLRGTGVVALLAIYPTTRWPDVGALAAFLCITIFVNGPLAPLLPATYEPVLMITGRAYHPLLVALIGIAGTLYIEYINYYLYRAAIMHPRLEGARQSKLVRKTVALFEKSPFFAVWLCAWSPLPYWAVRFLAPLSGYPVQPYLIATFLGRAPRLWFFAAIGLVVPVSTQVLVTITVSMVAIGIVVVLHRRPRGERKPAGGMAVERAATTSPREL